MVEQGTENPCVLGSIPSCGIFFYSTGLFILMILPPLSSKVLALPSPSKACMQYIFLLTIIFKFNYLFFNLQQPTTIFESIKSARAFGITIRLLNISVNSQTKSLEIKLPSIIKMSAIII